ncbi:uncharacterized protein LOC134821938 [Bolinopsis microptera]|uniref:uncharacterized protein LOC134821938 n=1 Tax=Bolinopsis microptera TaxID=2820187 RepID=UPI00307AF5C4
MMNYLAFEKHWNAAELNFILEDLGISHPTEENKEFVREIKIGLTKSEKTQAPQGKQLSSQSKKDPVLFNILVAHSAATPLLPETGQKQNDNETVVFCHSLPYEMLSIEHLNNFKNLVNKQLYVVQDAKDPALLDLLSKLLGVEASHEKSVPDIFNLKRGDAKQLQISPPSTDLLNYCPEQELKLFDERFREDLENHLGKSGYFFVSKCNGFFSKNFYNMSLDVSEIEMKEALVSFKLLDPFYTESGTKDFSKRISSSWNTNVNESSANHVEFRVMYHETLNVSRFATPLICSLLISRFMLIPRDGKLLIVSPDLLLAFHVNTQEGFDFVRVEICSESDQIITKEIRQYFSSLLRSREVQIDLKKLDMEILEVNETVKSNDIELADLESAQFMAPEKETLEGGYHLRRCNLSDLAATFWKGEIKLPVPLGILVN